LTDLDYLKEWSKPLNGANTFAKLGDKMLMVIGGPDGTSANFFNIKYTSPAVTLEKYSARQNQLHLTALTQIKHKQGTENFFFMLGFSPNNLMKVFAIERDFTKDYLQFTGWSGRAFGCYQTLCEGSSIEAVVYNAKHQKHMIIVGGGLIILDTMVGMNGKRSWFTDTCPLSLSYTHITVLTFHR
jgi:hypothetical protein